MRRNRGRDGRLVATMQRRRPLHPTREVAGDRSSPGRTRNTGVIGLRRYCRRPAARPDAPRKMPAVYENNISFCGTERARAMIDIYSSGCPGIYCSIVKKCARQSHCPPSKISTSETTGRYLRHVTMQNDESWMTIAKAVEILWILAEDLRGRLRINRTTIESKSFQSLKIDDNRIPHVILEAWF